MAPDTSTLPPGPTFPLPPTLPPTDTLFFPATISPTTAPLLLFLPGNPGLIHYYRLFLSTLSTQHPNLHILGASHSGFTPGASRALSTPWSWRWGPAPWNLSTQVAMKAALLTHALDVLGRRKVLLMAHSMGAFLSLELIARLKGEGDVVGGVMLFPTLLEIARSPCGRVLAPVLRSGVVRAVAGAAARVLGWVPAGVVGGVVRAVTGMGEEGGEVTTGMVRDSAVVDQTLVLAAEEMVAIDQDRWGEGVWNAGGGEKAGGMVYVFGKGDGWVAETTREKIMQRGGGARMVWEQSGIPHGFCIHHSVETAGLCGEWVRGFLGEVEG